MENKVSCPKCGCIFDVAGAVEGRVRKEIEEEFARKQTESSSKFQRMQENLEADMSAKVKGEIDRARTKALADGKAQAGAELADLQEQLVSQRDRLLAAQKAELDLRRRQRELESAREEFELDATRKLDAERSRIRDEASMAVSAQHTLKQAEWDKQRQELLHQVDEMRRRAEQGSQQAQGEVFELAIESALRDAFAQDTVEPVAKGVLGADVVQCVRTASGAVCGTIVYELKRTRTYSEGWLPKLRDNQREAKADLAVLVTHALPEGIKRIGQRDGVWVCSPESTIELATVLRASLQEIAQARRAHVGKQGKAEAVWDYLGGVEFRGRVQGLVEALVGMRESTDAERRAMEKMWAKREKELSRAMVATAGFYGDISGLGTSLQEIPQLTLGT